MRQDIINLWMLTKAVEKEVGEKESLESFLETLCKKEEFLKAFGSEEELKRYARKVIEEYEKEKLEEEEW